MRHFRDEPRTEQSAMVAALDDNQRIPGEVLGRDEPRSIAATAQAADTESAPLAERVALEAVMTADDRAIVRLDRSRAFGQPGADEIPERALADETDARRIPLVGDRQAPLAGDGPDFALAQAAHRKIALGQLRRGERMEEITLVLFFVDAPQQPPGRSDACVMSGRKALRAEAPRVGEPDAELDLAIAEHVRVRRAARFELRQKMRKYALAVFAREAGLVQRDPEFVGYASRVLEVGRRRAIAVLVLLPIRHEEGLDRVACIEQERRRDRRVDAAGERDDDAGHGGQPVAARSAWLSSVTCLSMSSG